MRAYPNFRGFEHADHKDREVVEKVLEGSPYAKPDPKRLRNLDDAGARLAMILHREATDRVRRGAALVKASQTTTREALLALLEHYGLDDEEFRPEILAPLVADAVRRALTEFPRTSFDDEVWIPVHYGLGLTRYDFVFVDEVQDLSPVQLALARSALAPGGRMILLGDMNQAIYGFRGASTESAKSFVDLLDAKVLPLTVSFRCPRKVVALARMYVPDFEPHSDAPAGEVHEIDIDNVADYAGPGDVILSRVNAPLAPLCLQLEEAGTRARINRSQDLAQALIRLVVRSQAGTVHALVDWLERHYQAQIGLLKPRTLQDLRDRIDMLRSFTEGAGTTGEVTARIDRFFAEARAEHVLLSTVHRFKGEEAARVFLLEDTFFLERGDPEEEKRIHYVGLTRTKSVLFLVRGRPRRDAVRGRHGWTATL
jgi:hypothetical protein